MPSPASIKTKLNAVLNRFAPTDDRTVYLRTITRSGGDPLTHTPGTTTSSDAKFEPQPAFQRIGRERIPGGHTRWEVVIDNSGEGVLADDYEFLLSPDAVTLRQLYDPDNLIVLIDSAGDEEELTVSDVDPVGLQGVYAAFTVYAHSARRP